MIKLTLMITLLVTFISCGTGSVDVYTNPKGIYPGGPTDAEFEPYVQMVETLTGWGARTAIQFKDDMDDSLAGVCYRWSNGTTKIYINTDQWNMWLNETQKELLIWHELGHCDFDLAHSEGLRSDGCPLSLMNHRLPAGWCADYYYEDYINDFLKRI